MKAQPKLRLLTIISTVLAVVTIALAVIVVVGWLTEEEPFDPISFINPALIQYQAGTVPRLPGIEGPAIFSDERLPVRWTEVNKTLEPVEATFSWTAQSFEIGASVVLFDNAPRSPFEPGVIVYDTLDAINPDILAEVELAAQTGICTSEWINIAEATPVQAGGVSTPFFSQNYTIVDRDCWDAENG